MGVVRKHTNTFRNQLPLLSLVAFLPCVIFSYLPVLALGTISGTHIDISLLYVLMAVVIAVHLPFLLTSLPTLLRTFGWKVLIGFTGYLWISALWSPNHFRAVMTAGFFTALVLLCSVIALRLPELQKKKQLLIKLGLWALLASSLFALWQIIADALHLPALLSGLPTMYTGDVFGIARPTAFALEPQFFGSLLLLPFAWSAWHSLTNNAKIIHYIVLTGSSTLLLLTLSRGALIAAFISFILLVIFARPAFTSLGRVATALLISCIISLGMIFSVSSLRTDGISGTNAAARTLNQLSIGIIAIPHQEEVMDPASSSTKIIKTAPVESSGYVSTSTDSRLSMSSAALTMWQTNVQSILFGVGVGGFGASLIPSHPGAVVNNYYLELLAEVGILGALLFVGFIGYIAWHLIRQKQWLLLALLVGLLTQMSFFSGNANIIHVWVIIGTAIGIVIYRGNPRKPLAS